MAILVFEHLGLFGIVIVFIEHSQELWLLDRLPVVQFCSITYCFYDLGIITLF